ncbi:MAG: 23S rRNA (adenine(2503)-C(2))-methyltransferase RlmN [Clostridia bacterium]|nr:23S rRNA (adenine(2503)-C(2))-methyltransferase RlmN [Clostridia bacterium]
MKILSDYSFEELKVCLAEYPSFCAKQTYDAILQEYDYSQTQLPKTLIEKLQKEYILKPVSIYKTLQSKDGTKKYLLQLCDDNIVECVFMHQAYGNTICLSTQVGCRMGCKFCASTINGRVRDLSAGEMLSIIAVVNSDNGKCTDRNFSNIVLMGSGEPFDNYDNVTKWLELITDKRGFNVSERNISLSTCGLVDKIYEFAKLKFNITLCVSLHATTDEIRKTIMPIANRYKIAEIVEALKDYVKTNGRRVVFEYCLIKGVNDSDEDVERLKSLTHNLLCHVNVICLNPNGGPLKATTKQEAYAFVEKLNVAGVSATLRRSQGSDIEGACGMLRAKTLKEKQ